MLRVLYHNRLIFGLTVLIIFSALAFFLVLPAYIRCQLDEYASNVEIVSIAIKEVSQSDLEIDVTVKVENHNPIGATIDRIGYDIYFKQNEDWIHLGRADRLENITIASHDVANVTVTHQIATMSTVKLILSAVRQEGVVVLRAIGSLWIKFGPVTTEVPFDHIRQVALWRID